MKNFLHSLQGRSNGNGTVQLDQNDRPVVDINTLHESHEVPGELQGQDLNGYYAYKDSNTNSMTSRDTSSISTPDMQKIQAECLAAGAVQLLLRLKRHLKIVYSLDDRRCQAFVPNEPPKPGETLSRQNVPLNISDAKVDPPNSYEELLRAYQDLKNPLKEDTINYSIYTANVKRKRPPPKRGGKTARMADIDDEDYEDDDDWGGSAKRLIKSGQKPITRRTRQRS